MILHKNLVIGVIYTLDNIFNNNIYADKAIEKTLKSNKKWGSKDKILIQQSIIVFRYSRTNMKRSPINYISNFVFFRINTFNNKMLLTL